MWLKSLHVENFRGFEKLDVTFDEHVTLLVGGNGAGKTAVLDAIAAGLHPLWSTLAERPPTRIPDADVRHVFRDLNGVPDVQMQWPVTVRMEAFALTKTATPHRLRWSTSRHAQAFTASLGDGTAAREFTDELRAAVRNGDLVQLPLLALYGADRTRPRGTAESRTSAGVPSRADGYDGSLSAGASGERLVAWMRRRTAEEVQQQQANGGYKHPQLRAVVSAVEACVDGVTGFRFDLMRDEIQVRVGERMIAYAMLSAGYRNMIAMVADIARRAATLNPQLGADAAHEAAGIVLIDEIELHLHPKWQRGVIPSLRRAFPKMQFIATTHSPQVLASVERGQVRLFDDNRLVDVDLFVEGRSSNELLEDVYGVPARPPATKAELDVLFTMIDDGDYAAARTKLSALEARLGRDDGDIVRARWILESEAGVTPAPPIAS